MVNKNFYLPPYIQFYLRGDRYANGQITYLYHYYVGKRFYRGRRTEGLTPIEQLGKNLFLTGSPRHLRASPARPVMRRMPAFTGPDSRLIWKQPFTPVLFIPGSVIASLLQRPMAAIAPMYFDDTEGLWDRRHVLGWTGDRLDARRPTCRTSDGADPGQVEQNMPHAKQVIGPLPNPSDQLSKKRGLGFADGQKKGVASTYEKIGRSIAAYERSNEVNPFTSKYDYYLKGEADLTAQEANGLALFEGKAMCSACHLSEPREGGEPPSVTVFYLPQPRGTQ